MRRKTDLVSAPTGLGVQGWEQINKHINKMRYIQWAIRAMEKIKQDTEPARDRTLGHTVLPEEGWSGRAMLTKVLKLPSPRFSSPVVLN